MISSAPVLLAGAAIGTGVVMAVAGLMPTRADVGDVMARMDASRLDTTAVPGTERPAANILERWGQQVLRLVGEQVLRVPTRELGILRESPALFVGRKLATALYGLALPTVATLVFTVVGIHPPLVIPALAGLAAALLFWFIPDLSVRGRAEEARTEFRAAIAAYLELVGLERAADAGPTEALRRAAAVGDGWVFERIRDALVRAELAGIAPWDGLRQLATEIDVPELGAPADIIAVAGEEGAAVYSTLRAQAASLRGVLLTDQQAQANEASEKMIMPVAGLVVLMTVYIAVPAMLNIIAS